MTTRPYVHHDGLPPREPGAAYMREWRKRNPDKYRRGLDYNNARERALHRLGRRHPVELDELIEEEIEQASSMEGSS